MTDALETLRGQAWNHVRRVIGDRFMYNDLLAGDDIFRMTASEDTAVTGYGRYRVRPALPH